MFNLDRQVRSGIARWCLFVVTCLMYCSSTAAEDLRVRFSGLGDGTVTSNPGGISAPADCDGTYSLGTTVTLTAAAAPGSRFIGWGGDATGTTNPITVTLDSDKSVRAVFELTTPIPTFQEFFKKPFSDANVNVDADTISITNHGFDNRQKVRFRDTSLPTGITTDQTYLVDRIDANRIKLLRLERGATLTPVDITAAASGETHTVFPEGLTPTQIRAYLIANPIVNSADRFLAAMDPEYKVNWLLMTRSESLQTGTAKYPRILLPSIRGDFVFTIGLVQHGSFPGSHPDAVEYMQWDPGEKNFRLHEVVLKRIPDLEVDNTVIFPAREPGVIVDDTKCSKCHSTRNVVNVSDYAGTTGFPIGSVKVKNKPNWDAYDSWGGMLGFNRDRIYQGSVEAAAFRKIFNLYNWRNSPENDFVRRVLEQLKLQPAGVPDGPGGNVPGELNHQITREEDGRIRFGFDPDELPDLEPVPEGADVLSINYSFDRNEGSGPGTAVKRGGQNFVTLHHSLAPISDEGRGVHLFDFLGGNKGSLNGYPNQMRIADEIITHHDAAGNVDVRPIALAISRFARMFGEERILQISGSTVTSAVPTQPLAIDMSFFNARNGLTIDAMIRDTRVRAQVISPQQDRAQSLPRRKADIQKLNLDRTGDIYLFERLSGANNHNGLIQEYGAFTELGAISDIPRLRQEVFRRENDPRGGPSDGNGLETSPDLSVMGGIFVDRETYGDPAADEPGNTEPMALYRYFLEPLGVSVDKWSMNVRGRSRGYNFADIFGTYTNILQGELTDSLKNSYKDPADPSRHLDPNVPADIIQMVNLSLASLPGKTDLPNFTEIQRIFNKGCIECHGGLEYPPYSNAVFPGRFPGFLDFSEEEKPVEVTPRINSRLARSHTRVTAAANRIRQLLPQTSEACEIGISVPNDLMPCQGPPLSKADIRTFNRWVDGGSPFSHGDPHIRTVDGVEYDFQADGEFILLTGIGMELQARQKAINTAIALGPDEHTGLTSCISVNSAVAVRIFNNGITDRVTYQPNLNGQPDPEGLQLRVNGELVALDNLPMRLPSVGRIERTSAEHGIQVTLPGGRDRTIIVTPTWWERQSTWIMNIDMRRIRATRGLMGSIAPNNWLPAMPDGKLLGSMPIDLNERFNQLYREFGDAWRVTDETSLFDYADGTSTADFTHRDWPRGEGGDCAAPLPGRANVVPLNPIPREEAEDLTAEIVDPVLRENCIKDVMTTGDRIFITVYQQADRILRSAGQVPQLIFPLQSQAELAGPIDIQWAPPTDPTPAKLTYQYYVWPVEALPDENDAVTVSKEEAENFYATKVENLEPGTAYYWKVIVKDGNGLYTESEVRRFETKK